jgi:hypothetical protein
MLTFKFMNTDMDTNYIYTWYDMQQTKHSSINSPKNSPTMINMMFLYATQFQWYYIGRDVKGHGQINLMNVEVL